MNAIFFSINVDIYSFDTVVYAGAVAEMFIFHININRFSNFHSCIFFFISSYSFSGGAVAELFIFYIKGYLS